MIGEWKSESYVNLELFMSKLLSTKSIKLNTHLWCICLVSILAIDFIYPNFNVPPQSVEFIVYGGRSIARLCVLEFMDTRRWDEIRGKYLKSELMF